ncbi:MAG: uncharacterized protein K0Q91_1132 [Fibrobacteria bacterium]|jgi:hypothetical protein|nr:uncharacterized protein [Fibrobacteria bacterium]
MSRPLGEDYFTRYGVNSPGIRKKDYARSWRHFTFSLPEILRIYRRHTGSAPRTFLDIGAADGSFMQLARERGLKVRGIENSPYILAQIQDRSLRARIQVGNAADLIRDFEPGAFDIILECAAQYLPPRRLDRYLKNLTRLTPGMVCLLVDPKNYQGDRGKAHTGVRTFETLTWWKRKMAGAGYAKCEGGFYFFRT